MMGWMGKWETKRGFGGGKKRQPMTNEAIDVSRQAASWGSLLDKEGRGSIRQGRNNGMVRQPRGSQQWQHRQQQRSN